MNIFPQLLCSSLVSTDIRYAQWYYEGGETYRQKSVNYDLSFRLWKEDYEMKLEQSVWNKAFLKGLQGPKDGRVGVRRGKRGWTQFAFLFGASEPTVTKYFQAQQFASLRKMSLFSPYIWLWTLPSSILGLLGHFLTEHFFRFLNIGYWFC